MYALLYHPRVEKFLVKIPKKDARRILEKIELLQKNPDSAVLDTKKLVNTKRSYRLRVGTIRVIYEKDDTRRVLYMHDMDFRGNIY